MMTLAERIFEHLKKLPEPDQAKVLDLVEFLEKKSQSGIGRGERSEWSSFSLTQAMRGLENEESLYTLEDLEETSA